MKGPDEDSMAGVVGRKDTQKKVEAAMDGLLKEDGKQVDHSAALDRQRWWMLAR